MFAISALALFATLCAVASAGDYGAAPAYLARPALYAAPAKLYASAAYAEPVYSPNPYNFGYNVDDGYGNNQHQNEEGDSYGNKRGSYGYTDAYGVYRKVDYIADDLGFRVTIKTNEPGTADSHPADAKIISTQPQVVAAAPAYAAPVYAAPAYAAPIYAAPVHAAPVYAARPVYKALAAPLYAARPAYGYGARPYKA